MKSKNNKGVTLIALVVTIIILLILAGIVLNLTIGENGIFKTVEYAVQKNSEETAKEKLELELGSLQIIKYTDEAYNENDYIDDYLNNKGMYVVGDIVTVDGWKFEIDRNKLEIRKGLGETKVKILQQVKEYIGKNQNNKYQVNILVTIESDEDIDNIIIQNPDGTIFEITPLESKKKIEKDMIVELDEEYTVILKTTSNKEKILKILEKSIETIKTTEELVAFRDKVNIGLTYEGKTIELLNNIDLSGVCGENINGKEISWEPIGNYGTDTTHIFKGKFNGNGHIINNIYINTTSSSQGLFGYVQKATIIGVIIGNTQDKNSTESNSKISIKGGSYVGAIAGTSYNSTIQNCGNNINITCSGRSAGGVVGSSSYDEIIGVYNKGDVIGATHSVGGIVGEGVGNNIKFSYNTGSIKGNYIVGGIVGSEYSGEVKHCYNIGEINRFLFIICA